MALDELVPIEEEVPPPEHPPDEDLFVARNGRKRFVPNWVPPNDLQAEEIVLGTMMASTQAAAELFAIVAVDDFWAEQHRDVAGAILKLQGQKAPTDPVAVWGVLADTSSKRVLDQGGSVWLATVFEQRMTVDQAKHHARRVAELSRRRGIYDASAAAVELLMNGAPAAKSLTALRREADLLERAQADADSQDPRLLSGGAFAFDMRSEERGPWGAGELIAWPRYEPMMIVSPTGIGKTTLAQRVLLSMIGLGPPEVLGLSVERTERPILYIAADRPNQASKSLRRMVEESQRDLLDEWLVFWKGPPPFSLMDEPARLATWAASMGVGTVVIDSLKDVAPGLAKDDVGAFVSQSMQYLVAQDIDLLLLHHQRKRQGSEKQHAPKTIDEVYGSGLITATCGSVVLLWGEPGDTYIDLKHLKMAEGDIGPMKLEVDHRAGTVRVMEGSDLLALLREATQGLSTYEAAALMYEKTSPTKNEVARAYRQLQRLEDKGFARRVHGTGVGRNKTSDRYFFSLPGESEPPQEEELF